MACAWDQYLLQSQLSLKKKQVLIYNRPPWTTVGAGATRQLQSHTGSVGRGRLYTALYIQNNNQKHCWIDWSGRSWKCAQCTSQRHSNIYFLGVLGGGFLLKCIPINIPSLTEVMIHCERLKPLDFSPNSIKQGDRLLWHLCCRLDENMEFDRTYIILCGIFYTMWLSVEKTFWSWWGCSGRLDKWITR